MGDGVDVPVGLATSVAPLPWTDPLEAALVAVRASPSLPTAPELGGTGRGPVQRALGAVHGATLDEAAARRDAAEDRALRQLLEHRGHEALGVRVEQPGPVTLSLALRRAGVDPPGAYRLARRCVLVRTAAVLDVVRRAFPDGVAVVVLREPALVGAMHPTFAMGPHDVHALLSGVVDDVDALGSIGQLIIGAHVPGPTDWPTIVASGVSMLSAPSSAAGPRAAVVADFLERGGRVAWGAVPVDRPLGTNDELLWRALSAHWSDLVDEGVDPVLLVQRSLVSTADGLEHFGASQARRALALLGSLAARVQSSTRRPVGV